MAHVVFYEKPGDLVSAKQKRQLEAAGHQVEARDLFAQSWTADALRGFFGDKPVDSWFNRQAPAVRSKAVKPAELDEAAALALLIADPDLIRRPLIEVGDRREAGFDPNLLHAWIGLNALGTDAESCDSKHSRGVCDHGHHQFPKAS